MLWITRVNLKQTQYFVWVYKIMLIIVICLSLHYNADNSYLFVNGKEIFELKAD